MEIQLLVPLGMIKGDAGFRSQYCRSLLAKFISWKAYLSRKSDGKTDFKSAPLGILVVKGKVSEVLGNSPKSKSAVDGMAGATLTGNGVTEAYRDVLSPYRPFN